MSDRTAWSQEISVADAAQAIGWDTDAWMYLEQRAETWLSEEQRRQGVRFVRYSTAEQPERWPQGRIFDTHQELRWERRGDKTHLIYCGPQPPAGFHALELGSQNEDVVYYYAWGRPVAQHERELVGAAHDEEVFIEMRIPRLLRYPLPGLTKRVQIAVHEYYGADGRLCHARWCGLRAEP